MARPTRLRRVPVKFLKDEFICTLESKKTRNKIATAGTNDVDTAHDVPKVVATKLRSSKGNLFDGKSNVSRQMARLSVLQDRTNLPGEHFKVDILVKKGADDETANKTPKDARRTAKSAAIKEDNHETPHAVENMERTRLKKSAPAQAMTKIRSRDKENSANALFVKSTAENAKKNEKAKKLETIDASDNSFVIESENAMDSHNQADTVAPRATTKKSRKSGASSKSSTTNKSDKKSKNLGRNSSGRFTKSTENIENIPTISNATAGKKFFKGNAIGIKLSERRILPDKKIVTSKRSKIKASEKPRASPSFRMRQTTLSESFAKHATKKNLRPRATQKNSPDNSANGEQNATNKEVTKKGPVYKTAKLLEKSEEEGSEVYEFNFNINDSQERIKKKRRRRAVKGVAKKTSAKASKKTMAKPQSAAGSETTSNKIEEARKEIPAASKKPTDIRTAKPTIVTSQVDLCPTTSKQPEKMISQPLKPKSQMENIESSSSKPRVMENVELTGPMRINLNSTPILEKSTIENATPTRTTTAYRARPSVPFRNMLGHALLNKSLSPITKALENFDPGSPWRPPPITNLQFSRVKNVVQSTPQVRKFSAMLNTKDAEAETVKTQSRINVSADKKEQNINSNLKIVKPISHKTFGSAKSPRKFGTVISNVDSTNCSPVPVSIRDNSEKSESNRGSPQKMTTVLPPRLATPSVTDTSAANNPTNDFDDKENSIPLFESPKKSLRSPKKLFSKSNTLRILDRSKFATNENSEPQPGPSGLQNRRGFDQSRVLRQSNLNNFLNIDEFPTKTTISSPHGIFADAHSTPIAGKIVKTIVQEPNVENAFGFDDTDDTNGDVLTIKNGFVASPLTNRNNNNKIATTRNKVDGGKAAVLPTRFSIGDIKRHLWPLNTKDNDKDDPVERIEREEMKNRRNRADKLDAENVKNDCANFSNTFDLTENPVTNDDEDWKEVPLFADLEPVHFKQPPRHSYKRKRNVAFNHSDYEDEEGEPIAFHDNHGTKKRKMTKHEKERQKRVEEWAKDLNNTFEEIDHFDLVVE